MFPDSHQLYAKGIYGVGIILNWRDFVFWVGSQPVLLLFVLVERFQDMTATVTS